MAVFDLSRTVPLSAQEAWHRVTDWPGHSRMPLTRVRVAAGSGTEPGSVVLARTGAGPVGFDDPMEITVWQPPAAGAPGLCRLEKRGRVVRGWAEIRVEPVGTGSVVAWREDIRCAGMPPAVDRLLAAAGRPVFGRVLDALLRAAA